jgi:hypothetical protein
MFTTLQLWSKRAVFLSTESIKCLSLREEDVFLRFPILYCQLISKRPLFILIVSGNKINSELQLE